MIQEEEIQIGLQSDTQTYEVQPYSKQEPFPNPDQVHENISSKKSILIWGLLTLTIVAVGIGAYIFLQNQSLKSQLGLPTSELSESKQDFLLSESKQVCEYNGQIYQPGEGFMVSGGCNSCTCGENGEVACTAIECEKTNPPLTEMEPITLDPDQSGKFNLNSTRLGFSASFNAQNMLVTNCQGSGEGYEFWIYSPDTDMRAGVCSYEGPSGILISDIQNISQAECLPDDETYSSERSERVINNNSLVYCQSTLKVAPPDSPEPFPNLIVSAYIKNPSDDSAIRVWMLDPQLQPVFDQILSTFKFNP